MGKIQLYTNHNQEEKLVSEDLIEFILNKYNLDKNFTIKSVAKKEEKSLIENPVIGFYFPYGVAYISNPQNDIGIGAINFKRRKIIYNPNEKAFYNNQNSLVYSKKPYYIREDYPTLLKEFEDREYTFHLPSENGVKNYISRATNLEDIEIGRKIDLERLLKV